MLNVARALLAASLLFTALAAQAQSLPSFTETVGFATKTGFRGVFAWKATAPVEGLVRFGTSPAALTQTAEAMPNVADTAGIAITDALTRGTTYYFQVEDKLTGAKSPVRSFAATNSYTDWNGSTYTLDLLVQLDLQSLPPEIPHDLAMADIAAGINIFAERVYDALDGYARIGRVIVTDTNLQYAANVPFQPAPCQNLTNLGDVLIQTTVPFDSHTFTPWRIDDPCTQFYVGRIGQLVIPWQDDLHFGYVMTHEMMHYAFSAPDLYPEAPNGNGADCRNLDWDGSVMHNTGGFNNGKWELTELDRNPSQTPCTHGTNGWSWDTLREKYANIPANAPIQHMYEDKPRGNEDGGALEIWILDREPGASTLTRYTPDDQNPTCGNQLPQITDAEGDATILHEVDSLYVNEPSLDVTKAWLTWDNTAKAVTFNIKVKDLTDLPPLAGTGIRFRFFFEYGGKRMQIRADRNAGSAATFTLASLDGATTLASGLAGNFNATTDIVSIVLPASKLDPSLPPLDQGEEFANFEIMGYRLVMAAGTGLNLITEIARGNCPYLAGQENFGPNTAPSAANDSASTNEDAAVTVNVLTNDSDPDHDALSIRSIAAPANGTAAANGNAIVYTPKANFSGSDSFTYTITDRKGGTAGARVNVTIAAVPDAPVAAADASVAAPGGTITIPVLANDSDADGDALTLTAVSTPRSGTATHDGAKVTYKAAATFAGADTFNYTIRDATGRTATGTITVTALACLGSWSDDFEPAPEAGWKVETQAALPVVGPSPVAQKWQVLIDPLAHSPSHSYFSDTSDLSGSKDDNLISPPMKLTNASKLRFWHRFGFEETYDGGVLEVSTNNGATWNDVTAAGGTFESGGYTGTASAYGTTRPAWTGVSPQMTEVVVNLGALGGSTALVRWRTRTDSNSGSTGWFVDDVTFTGLTSTNCQVSNRAPDAVDDSAATTRNRAVAIAVLANDSDPDGDAISISAVGSPAHGTAAANGNSITYTPAANFSGTDTFSYTINDGLGGSDTAAVSVTVYPPPTANDDTATTNEDQTVTIDVTANDSPSVHTTSVSAPAHGTASANGDNSVSYTPAANYNGSDSFTYTISDDRGETATATVTVTVQAVNDAPVARADSAATSKNKAVIISVLANDNDADGDALRIVSVGGNMQKSAVTINSDGTLRYKPKPGYTGSDSFTYTISDEHGGVSTATVSVTIQ
ncbi:MAG TPA: Ig-like domain-containing protein [Thermoanaerobaculia bacterium]|nr:Ig-like domain-containing protein [Thermoanaerobaculia bacterium]